MATLHLTIDKTKALKNGNFKIKIAVFHKNTTRHINTPYDVPANHFKDGRIVKEPNAEIINAKLRTKLNKLQSKLDEIDDTSIYTCKQLKDILCSSSHKENRTFAQAYNEYIEYLSKNKRNSYAEMIIRACKYFLDFTKGDILLADITTATIENFRLWLIDKRKINGTYLDMTLGKVKVIINRAEKLGYVRYDIKPFATTTIQKSVTRESWISIDTIQAIRNAELHSFRLSQARDIFFLSFYLGGMNLADMVSIKYKGKDEIDFVRKKTIHRTTVERHYVLPIIDEARAIIDKYMTNAGILNFGKFKDYRSLLDHVSKGVTALSKEINLEPFSFYTARKTFANFASELGIPDNVIDYCLAHSDSSRGTIRHYTNVNPKKARIAIERVADYVSNPDKYKDYIEMRSDIMMMKD